ncbi:hypothetical protein GCM10010405_49790 [Streptomyces macrosporus]|uniref:Uncharacterized protein n=1 Tax=Streptomyces macrosporus TaxID=44032 RepID=A0ABP5XNW3_9ACTN
MNDIRKIVGPPAVRRSGRRWRRFGLLAVPAVAAAGAVLVGVAQDAPAASVAASGNAFQAFGDIQLTQVDAQALSGAGASGNGLGGLTGSVSHPVAVNPKFTGRRGAADSFTRHDVSVLVKPGDHEYF